MIKETKHGYGCENALNGLFYFPQNITQFEFQVHEHFYVVGVQKLVHNVNFTYIS